MKTISPSFLLAFFCGLLSMYQGSSLGLSGLALSSSRFTKKHDSDGTIAPDVQPFHEAPKFTSVPLAPRPNNTASEEWLKEIKPSRKLRESFNDIQNNHVSVEISIGSNKYVLNLDELQLNSPEKLGQILHQFDNLRKPDDHISVQYFYSKRHQPLNPKKAKNVLDSMTLIDYVLKIVSDEEQIKLIQPLLSYSQLFWAFGSAQFDMLIGSDKNGQFLVFNAKQLSEESLGNNFLKDISSPLTLIVKKNTRNAQENLLTSREKNNLNINLLMMATKLSSFAGDLNVYYSDTYSLMPAQLSPKFVNQLLDLPLTVSQQDENSQQISHVNHELVSSRPVVVDFGKSQFIIDPDKFLLNSPEDQQFFLSLFSLLFRSGVITQEEQQNAPHENVSPKKPRQPKSKPLDDDKDLNIAVNLRENFEAIIKEISELEFESDHHQQAKNKMVESLNKAMGAFWGNTPSSRDSYKIFNSSCQKAMGDAEEQFAKHGGLSLWRDIIVPILNTLIKIVTLIGKWVNYLDKKYEPKYYENPLTQAQLFWQKQEKFKPNFRDRLEENLDDLQEQIDDPDKESPSP